MIQKQASCETEYWEPEAASTEENIAFSLDLIEREFGVRPEKLGVISAEYHLL